MGFGGLSLGLDTPGSAALNTLIIVGRPAESMKGSFLYGSIGVDEVLTTGLAFPFAAAGGAGLAGTPGAAGAAAGRGPAAGAGAGAAGVAGAGPAGAGVAGAGVAGVLPDAPGAPGVGAGDGLDDGPNPLAPPGGVLGTGI